MTGIIRFGRNALGWGPPSSSGWRRSGTTDIPAADLPTAPAPPPPPPPPPLLPPVLLTAPTISSVNNPPRVADTITASHGTYSGTLTGYSGAWFSGTSLILGATGLTYTAQAGDAGNVITYQEQGANAAGGSAVGISNALGPVAAIPTVLLLFLLEEA